MGDLHLSRKFFAALLANILTCIWIAYTIYAPIANQPDKGLHWSFGTIYFLYLIALLPFFLIGGMPFSILVDNIWDRMDRFQIKSILRLAINLFVYGLGGILLFRICILVIPSRDDFNELHEYLPFYQYCLIGGILFNIMDELLSKIRFIPLGNSHIDSDNTDLLQ